MSDITTAALDAEYARVIPARFTNKRDGTPMACMTCGTPLAMGSTFAATNNNGWHSYCAKCAASTQAQIAGLVQRIETLVAPLGTNVPAAITSMVANAEPAINAVLGRGNPTPAEFLDAKGQLLNIRTSIGAAKAANQPAPVRTNQYGGKCQTCGVWVEPGTGRIEKQGRWVTFHLDGQCPTPQAAVQAQVTPVELGLYLHDNGAVHKVYKTRNDRPAVKVLVPQTTGEVNEDGTPRLRGSFQYVSGGVRIVREALAAGTAHKLTQDEAAKFGREFSFCVNCGLYLDDDRSLAAGYGPTCAENNRWFYPSYTEASAILGRPAGPNSTKATATPAVAEATPTMVCENCDEVLTVRPVVNEVTGQWADLPVDSTGSEVCSGDDAPGPDFRHQPVPTD